MVSAPTSLKAGDLIGVIHALPTDQCISPPGWYWRDKKRGLAAFKWHGPYESEAEARENAITPMTLNRAALPTTPKYPATPKALFAQLREMGVGCGSCVNIIPSQSFERYCDVIGCVPSGFRICGEWEAGE